MARLRNPFYLQAVFLIVFVNEEVDQEGNVIPSFPEWREFDRHHIEAIEEIFSKEASFDLFLEVPVARRNDSNIHSDRFVSSRPLKLPFLKDPEKFDLGRGRDILHFIQKQGAVMGQFKATLPR